MKKQKKILITGGAGFIGSHLANRIIDEGHEILVIDNLSKGKKDNLNRNVHLIKQDITSKKFKDTILKYKPNIIYHFAAQSSLKKSVKNPKSELRVNFLPIIEITDAIRSNNLEKIIFSSSAAVYGDLIDRSAKEAHRKEPVSPYGIAKLATENYLTYFNRLTKTPHLILRFSNVYGPKQRNTNEGGVVAIFIKNILKNKKIFIYGDGTQTRDFIFVDDVVEACIKGLNKEVIGSFNISTKKETSINKLYKMVAKSLSYQGMPSYAKKNDFDVIRSNIDYSLFKLKTKWYPKTNMDIGIKRTIEYFKSI